MKSMTLAFALALSGCAALPAPATAHSLDGIWVNEAGSAVAFSVADDGRISGDYRTELGAPDSGARFPLTGWAQRDVVSFSVSFTNFGSITSWSGQISEDRDGDYIRTLWHLSRDVADEAEEEDLWQSITAGAAVFRRVDGDDKT